MRLKTTGSYRTGELGRFKVQAQSTSSTNLPHLSRKVIYDSPVS
jgi:hypothetical protein